MKIDIDEEVSMVASRASSIMDRAASVLDRAFEHVDRVFDDVFGAEGVQAPPPRVPFSGRKYRVLKGKEKVVIEVEIPGVAPSDVSVNAELGLLKIGWKRQSDSEEIKGEYAFSISRNADVPAISARAAHGLLTVVIPVAESPASPSHSVKVEAG